MPLKIIHIHNDVKFTDETAIFKGSGFINEVIIFGEKGKYNGKYKETAKYLKTRRSNIYWLIDHCNKADMIVMYNLCVIKSYIANRLDGHIKIAWRFFGHELYKNDIASQLSELSNQMLEPDKQCFDFVSLKARFYQLRNLIRNFIMPNFFQLKNTGEYEFTKAANRVDFFLWHYKKEYEYLKEKWPDLPKFIGLPTLNLPTLKIDHNINDLPEKQNLIILGNSKSALNNHFDVLKILFVSKNFNNYQLNIPYSYGGETNYSAKLREKITDYKNITLAESFVPLHEYKLMFSVASAVIINTYRQKALGNILLALKYGVKVYLNKKNITYSILASQGFFVFSIDQLFDDLEKNNIRLSLEEVKHNETVLQKLGKENSIQDFQQKIYHLITNNNNVN